MKQRRRMTIAVLVAASAVACAASAEEPYPNQAIRVIVPTSPGGNVDATARVVSTAMAKILKTSMVVQNMPGAANAIGEAFVARARPDGYTILFGNDFSVVTTADLVQGATVKLDDFSVIGMATRVPAVFAVKAGNEKKIGSFADFLRYAKAQPGKLSVGNAGLGSINHVAELMIERTLGVDLIIIPFKGSGPAIPAVMGGQVDGLVDQVSSAAAMIKAGELLPLAVTSARRVPDLPQVPTLAELSNSDFDLEVATVMAAPKGTAPAVLQTLNAALNEALKDPAVLKSFQSVGATPYPTSLQGATHALAALQAKMKPLIDSGLLTSQKVD